MPRTKWTLFDLDGCGGGLVGLIEALHHELRLDMTPRACKRWEVSPRTVPLRPLGPPTVESRTVKAPIGAASLRANVDNERPTP